MDTFEEYEQAEALARNYQRTERAESLRDEFISHDRSSGRHGPLGRYNLVGAQGLVLPPLRSTIAIGIVLCLIGLGLYAISRHSDARTPDDGGVAEVERAAKVDRIPPIERDKLIDRDASPESAAPGESKSLLERMSSDKFESAVEKVTVLFDDIDEHRKLSYRLRINKDTEDALININAFVRGAASPVRHSVRGRCTLATSGFRKMHTCEAVLPSTLPKGAYVFEIAATGMNDDVTKTGQTKSFKLK